MLRRKFIAEQGAIERSRERATNQKQLRTADKSQCLFSILTYESWVMTE